MIHTYRLIKTAKGDVWWEVGIYEPDQVDEGALTYSWRRIVTFDHPFKAAKYASWLNGGDTYSGTLPKDLWGNTKSELQPAAAN